MEIMETGQKKVKIDYSLPLTKEQADFAEKNHNLVHSYLIQYRLPHDDYYSLAAQGLIRATQAWFQSEYTRSFQFSTVAYWNMRSTIFNYKRSIQRRYIETLSLDRYNESNSVTSYGGDSGGAHEPLEARIPDMVMNHRISSILDSMVIDEMFQLLTEEQKFLITALAEGWSQVRISKYLKISQPAVSRRIIKARKLLTERYAEVM